MTHDEARQLRDELTAFLGDEQDDAIRNATTMWKRMDIADDYSAFLLRLTNDMNVRRGDEIDRLQAENERLRSGHAEMTKKYDIILKDNAFIERECQRLTTEAETLRQRVASLEKDNADLQATAILRKEAILRVLSGTE